MMLRSAIFIVLLLVGFSSGDVRLEPLSDEMIRYINEESGALWKAGPSKKFKSVDDVVNLLGARHEPPLLKMSRRPTMTHDIEDDELPEEFDARVQWPKCPTISEIRDQSSCGSCWAFGAAEAMSDRLCIHSEGKTNVVLSARDLLSCCENCGYGCEGGYPGKAWDYWKNYGLVTGGSKEQGTGCQPYPFPSCTHRGESKLPKCPEELYPTPECETVCAIDYSRTYRADKYFAKSSYNVLNHEKMIMKELMINGPAEAAFDVYADFANYQSGIYHHVEGKLLGGHAIRILGWGVEGETKYWLLANSWNEEWGEKGFFRIRRGDNECGIEGEIVAGMPQSKK